MSDKVRVGLIGSGFVSAIHVEALKPCGAAEIIAVASPSPGKAESFARKHGIRRHFEDYRKLLEMD
ncbi:MAG: Gfo/Idh/MocA family oxidoreductase, partial [Limisphaerales bacterium]